MSGIGKALIDMSPAMFFATSLVAKDVVGCVMYTSTARANKQYTPEKRSDVANYDLANGIINVGLQLLAIKPIEYFMQKISDAKLMKHFYNDLENKLKDTDKKAVMKLLEHKEKMVKGSVALISTILCQYVIKRFISPFLSMPASQKMAQIGVVKPKLYEGETYEGKKKGKKLDVVSK